MDLASEFLDLFACNSHFFYPALAVPSHSHSLKLGIAHNVTNGQLHIKILNFLTTTS